MRLITWCSSRAYSHAETNTSSLPSFGSPIAAQDPWAPAFVPGAFVEVETRDQAFRRDPGKSR